MKHLVAFMACAASCLCASQAYASDLNPSMHLQEDTVAKTPTAFSRSLEEAPACTSKEGTPKVEEPFKPTVKLGGCIMTQYSTTDRENLATDGGFNVRIVRALANGMVWKNVAYRLQLELSGAPGVDRGPRILDAYTEWTRYKEWQPRLGQFKRCFGFDNPIHPMMVGFGSFSQIAIKLQSIGDRIGEHVSNGRDVGFQMQGDLLPMNDGHRLLHYQVGVYNGQGTNHKDIDRHKDLIGGLWVMPTKDLRIGAFGWNGYYTDEKNLNNTLRRARYDIGFTYEGAWSARGEYAHSVGGTTKGGPTESDGWYAMVGVPVPQCKDLKVYGRWDCYRDDATRWNSLITNWGIALNYYLGKQYVLQLNYTHTVDRNLAVRGGHYNTLDLQVSAKF